jgi:DNA-binding response OmpR family regulator
VVVMTSSKEERDVVAGYNLGATSYIQKPVDPDQFQETVRTIGLTPSSLINRFRLMACGKRRLGG